MLDAWLRSLASAKVSMGDVDAIRAELSAWLELIDRIRDGETWAEGELMRLVSFHARNLGADGHPASAALMQVALLEDALEDGGRRADTRALTSRMMQLVADAHEAGLAQRLAARHRGELARSSPVIRIGDRAVVGFLCGPLHADLLDALFGRILRECVRTGAHIAVIDTLGTNADDELFYRTVEGMQRMPPGDRLRIILTGLPDLMHARTGLNTAGANLSKIALAGDVSEVISELGA